MIDLLNIVSSVFGYILFGFFVNKLQILPKKYIDYFDFTNAESFNVGSLTFNSESDIKDLKL